MKIVRESLSEGLKPLATKELEVGDRVEYLDPFSRSRYKRIGIVTDVRYVKKGFNDGTKKMLCVDFDEIPGYVRTDLEHLKKI
jgi:hypothetical protein